MYSKFNITQDELATFIQVMINRKNQYLSIVNDIRQAFNSFCNMDSFEGNRANAAKEYCSIHYGWTTASIPELISEVAETIKDYMYLWELAYNEFDSEEKFSIDEETLDEEEVLINGVRKEDFADIHQSVLDAISPISDILSLSAPETSQYDEICENLVDSLNTVKTNVYDIEEAQKSPIEKLNERLDILLALVESYSNKEKRIDSYESSDEIITKELQKALDAYGESLKERELHADILEIAEEYHKNTIDRLKHEEAERIEAEGICMFFRGLAYTAIGAYCIIASGGIALPVLSGLGYLSGTGVAIYGTGYIFEGAEVTYYGLNEITDYKSHNLIRDYVFDGNQELYDLVGETCLKASLLVTISGGFTNTLPKGCGVAKASELSGRVVLSKTGVFVAGLGASEYFLYEIEKYCKKKGFDSCQTALLELGVYIGTFSTIIKIGNYAVDKAFSTNIGAQQFYNNKELFKNIESSQKDALSTNLLEKTELKSDSIHIFEESNKSIPFSEYDKINQESLHNAEKDNVMLGKYDNGGQTSSLNKTGYGGSIDNTDFFKENGGLDASDYISIHSRKHMYNPDALSMPKKTQYGKDVNVRKLCEDTIINPDEAIYNINQNVMIYKKKYPFNISTSDTPTGEHRVFIPLNTQGKKTIRMSQFPLFEGD